MSLLGNLIWLIFGGLIPGLGYILGGIGLCLTLIGIPFGLQSIKLIPLIGVGAAFAAPPSEPCMRFSRTRLSGQWFPHRDWQAKTWAWCSEKSPRSAK